MIISDKSYLKNIVNFDPGISDHYCQLVEIQNLNNIVLPGKVEYKEIIELCPASIEEFRCSYLISNYCIPLDFKDPEYHKVAKIVCACGKPPHGEAECEQPVKCVNCNGPHSAGYKGCETYKEEAAIQRIKVLERIPYSEAKKKLQLNTPRTDYRPPYGDYEIFEECLESLLGTFYKPSCQMILLGDFNLNSLDMAGDVKCACCSRLTEEHKMIACSICRKGFFPQCVELTTSELRTIKQKKKSIVVMH
nr:unnamed protein product [Callosobruchus analis]